MLSGVSLPLQHTFFIQFLLNIDANPLWIISLLLHHTFLIQFLLNIDVNPLWRLPPPPASILHSILIKY